MLIKGWCYLELSRLADARNAFEAALGNSRTQQDAAYGAALTLLLRGRLTDDAEAMVAMYPMAEKRDREVRAEIYWQRARSAFDHKQYQKVLDALDARASLVAEPADLSQLLARLGLLSSRQPGAGAGRLRPAEHAVLRPGGRCASSPLPPPHPIGFSCAG